MFRTHPAKGKRILEPMARQLGLRELTTDASVAKVSIICNNKYVYTDAPKKAEVKLQYTDMEPEPGKTSFYYVRIEQTDGNLAWASPMWITYRGK